MPLDAKALGAWIDRMRSGADGAAPPAAKAAPGGIDFAAVSRRMYEEATPEQRARLDAHRAERARIAETASEIPATFERLGTRPGRRAGEREERHVERTWERNVGVQIEGEPGAEVIRFTGAVTGHEAYRIDEDFCRLLEDPEENAKRPRFYICAGTAGRYDACSVDPADVAAYLRERMPEMFTGSPAP